MSEIVTVPLSAQRDIKTVTVEIRQLHRQGQEIALRHIVEIGRRLKEAKEMMEHGEWGTWVKEELPFSQSTAGNFMRIYEEYGADQASIFGEVKSQALANLSYTKALRLLAIEDEGEREAFAESHDVASMSTRELERAITEKNELQRRVAELEIGKGNADMELDAVRKQLAVAQEDAISKENALQVKLDAAEKSAAEVKAAMDKAKTRAAAAEEKLKKLEAEKQEISPEDAARLKAEAAAEAEGRLEELRRQLAAADPDTAVFRERFSAVQREFDALQEVYVRIKAADSEKAGKLKTAAQAVVDKLQTQLKEVW